MPTYLMDLTASDRYLTTAEHRELLRRIAKNPRPGWEFRESWKVGNTTFYRFTKTVEAAAMSDACDLYSEEAEELGLSGVPITASLAMHDVAYDPLTFLPYRYTKPRPRRARGGARELT